MKNKITLAFIALTVGSFAFAQVGVNTATPAATFDITAKAATGNVKTAEGLILPRVDRLRAQSMTGVITSTLIYVNNPTTGTQTGTAVNIDKAGYYYFDGTAWIKLLADLSGFTDRDNNIYNINGTVTTNRVVTQGDKALAFTGSAVNAFSVDGTTFSVDTQNNRVGLGTIAPTVPLHVNSATSGALRVVDGTQANNRVLTSDANGVATWKDLPAATANTNIYTNDGTLGGNRIVTQGNNTLAFNSTATTGTSHFTVNGTTFNVDARNRRVGIGTATPETIFDVTGNGTGFQHSNGTVKLRSFLGADYSSFGTSTNHNLSFMSNNTLRMTIATDGKVGIGTQTPKNLLDLGAGNGKKLALWNSAAGDDFYGFGNSINVLQLFAGATETGDALMTLNKNGRVGIGTTTPTNTLDVRSSTAGAIKIVDGTQGANKVLTSDANGVGTWKEAAIDFGVANITRTAFVFPGGINNAVNTGKTITLPPGKWLITLAVGIYFPSPSTTYAYGTSFIRFRLSDTTADLGSQSFIADALQPRLASAGFSRGERRGMVNGQLGINNTTNGNKTYYIFVDAYDSQLNNQQNVPAFEVRYDWNETSVNYQRIN